MTWKKPASALSRLLFPQVLPSLLPVMQSASTELRLRASQQATGQPHQNERLMHLTVRSCDVTRLLHVIMQSCGAHVSFMRLSPLEQTCRMQLCLCVQSEAMPAIMDAVMRALPQAEFGLRQRRIVGTKDGR